MEPDLALRFASFIIASAKSRRNKEIRPRLYNLPESTPGPPQRPYSSLAPPEDDGKPLISVVLDDEDGDPVQEDDGAVCDDGKPVISIVLDDEDGDPVQESDRAVDGDLVPSKEVEVGAPMQLEAFRFRAVTCIFAARMPEIAITKLQREQKLEIINSWYNQQYGEGR
ncbi:hypothetical protein OIU85_030147 [Salix viminalis]|uniref:Uncharacterized protein n=1 Tax=Salix viminalis TaxID=40686 RepID=A0A9Q0QCZ9_SALVM|nr:hypothetical protein OIU85_030147 [Salix viminalis]